jgi:DNA-binding beta-propeller fold protein YncE
MDREHGSSSRENVVRKWVAGSHVIIAADIAVDAAGRALVTLAGVDEFAIGRLDDVIWTRIPVGRRPTALAYDAARRRAYVAHTFDDSISVVDCDAGKRIAEISLGPKIAALSSQYAVGLEGDGGFKFNPPSLRGVSQRGPYFHETGRCRWRRW